MVGGLAVQELMFHLMVGLASTSQPLPSKAEPIILLLSSLRAINLALLLTSLSSAIMNQQVIIISTS